MHSAYSGDHVMTVGAFAIIYMDFATSFWWFCHHSQYVLEWSYVVVSILYLVFCSFDGGMLYLVFHLCGSGWQHFNPFRTSGVELDPFIDIPVFPPLHRLFLACLKLR